MPATVVVQAGCGGEGTKTRVPVGAELIARGESVDPKRDRCLCPCSGRLRLLAGQMLRQAGRCGLMGVICRCMGMFGWERARCVVGFLRRLNNNSALSTAAICVGGLRAPRFRCA